MRDTKLTTLLFTGVCLIIAGLIALSQPAPSVAARRAQAQDTQTPTLIADTPTPTDTPAPNPTIPVTPNPTPVTNTFQLYLPYVLAIRNTAPVILSAPAGLTVNEDTVISMTFVLSDAQSDGSTLLLSATPLSPTLIQAIELGGSGEMRSVIITPALNATGAVPIVFAVSDGQLQAQHPFVLTLLPVNDAPAIDGLRNIAMRPSLTRTVEFRVTDVESGSNGLTLTLDSTNASLLPVSQMTLGGQDLSRTLDFTPSTDVSGTSVISISASDGELTQTTALAVVVSLDACPEISSNSYITVAIQPFNGSVYYKDNRLIDENADFRLSVLGYTPTNALKDLVDYGGDVDPLAPRIYGVFKPKRSVVITQTYQRFDWIWDEAGAPPYGLRGGINAEWPVSIIDLDATLDEKIYIPERPGGLFQTGIWEGDYKALVLYAAENDLLISYTRNDRVDHGYALYLSNLCVDVNLVKTYRDQLLNGKRNTGWLPALRNSDVVGSARNHPLTVAVRDSGPFLDPRARKDWWQGY